MRQKLGLGLFWVLSALTLVGCGTLGKSGYPNLRDMPSLPEGKTGEAERQRIIKELQEEREGVPSTPSRTPAVPPKPVPRANIVPRSNICAEDVAVSAPAVPPLRGTLHNEWSRPAVAPLPNSEGITAATGSTTVPGSVAITFALGASALLPADRTRLRQIAEAFVIKGGETVQIQVRGGSANPASPKPLTSVALGLARATSIAEALIAGGIAANRIKIAAVGEEDIPAMESASWTAPGPDGAVITFQLKAQN